MLAQSKTDYFLDYESYTMVDLHIFPFISRFYYLKNSALHETYEKLDFENRYKNLYKWVAHIRSRPELNDGKAIIPVDSFKAWLIELAPMELGTKPPLRLPMHKL